MVRFFGVFVLSLFYLVNPVWALELYQWLDNQGNLHIVDSLEKIPPQYRDKASRLEFKTPSRPKPVPEETSPLLETQKNTDIYGHTLEWYLQQKQHWLKKAQELDKQIQENKRVMQLLHRGVPQARRGTRTKYGLKLGQGPILRRWAEYKRLQKINRELERMREKAYYMAQKGLLRQAARAGAPPEWLEAIKKDP